MGLQVRLVHSLGDRLIDLPEKSMDSPIVIGRSGDADVPIPSVGLSRRHCVLFMEDGRWMLQDTSGGRTYLNGQPAVGAMAILSQDVVTLGSDPSPPTLVIDPYGLDPSAQGGSGETEADAPEAEISHEAARPTQPYGGFSAPIAGGSSVPQPRAYAERAASNPRGRAAQFVASEQPTGDAGDSSDPQVDAMGFNAPPSAGAPVAGDSSEDWMGQPAALPKARERSAIPRKKKNSSAGLIGIGAGFTVVILGVAAYIVHVRTPEAVVAPPAPVETRSKATSIFDFGSGQGQGGAPSGSGSKGAPAPGAPAPTAPAPRIVVRTPVAPPAPIDAAAEEARNSDPKWQNLADVHRNTDPVLAIVMYNDFARDNPPNLYAAELRQFTDDALDRIWWSHIAELMNRREEVSKELDAKAEELAQSADPEFKKGLQAEKAAIEERLARIGADLAELKYDSKEKPNLYDPNQIMTLRQARDPELFNEWKKSAEERIKGSRGQRSVW